MEVLEKVRNRNKGEKRAQSFNTMSMIDGNVDVSLSISCQLFKITSVQSGFDVEG